jgi:hypothetical protein
MSGKAEANGTERLSWTSVFIPEQWRWDEGSERKQGPDKSGAYTVWRVTGDKPVLQMPELDPDALNSSTLAQGHQCFYPSYLSKIYALFEETQHLLYIFSLIKYTSINFKSIIQRDKKSN